MTLELQPIGRDEARAFVREHHRHHLPAQGWKFGIAINDGERVVGVICVGRPVARAWDNGWVAEVTRCCVLENVPNGCSKLYAAAWRACRAMGYKALITYTLASESGVSLKASGYRVLHKTKGRSWDSPKRPRVDKHPTSDKVCWLRGLDPHTIGEAEPDTSRSE